MASWNIPMWKIGNTSSNGPFSIAILVYGMVIIRMLVFQWRGWYGWSFGSDWYHHNTPRSSRCLDISIEIVGPSPIWKSTCEKRKKRERLEVLGHHFFNRLVVTSFTISLKGFIIIPKRLTCFFNGGVPTCRGTQRRFLKNNIYGL